MTGISQDVLTKVQHLDLSSTVGFFDHDLTLAKKPDPKNPDHSPIELPHYLNMKRMADAGARIVVVTARGEVSAKGYLTEHAKEHGVIPGLVLASNSGHLVNDDIYGKGSKRIIPIHGYSNDELQEVVGGIHGIVKGMKGKFPDIVGDERELCGAVIYKLSGNDSSDVFRDFNATARELVHRLPEKVAELIEFSPKHWHAQNDLGATETHGYIDFKPVGMSKFGPTEMLLKGYMEQIGKDRIVAIAAGDSKPDAEMMRAVISEIPEKRRVLFSVGPGLADWANESGVTDLNVLRPNGLHPVDQFHRILAQVGVVAPTSTPVRSNTVGRTATILPTAGFGSGS